MYKQQILKNMDGRKIGWDFQGSVKGIFIQKFIFFICSSINPWCKYF